MHTLPRVRPAVAFLAGIGAVALLFAGGVAAASPGAGRADSTWTIQPTPNRSQDFNELTAITANSASDAWAVGTFRGPSSAAFKTLIEHFDGSSWRAVQSPNVGTSNNELNGVAADSSTNAWAVGFEIGGSADRTLVERWNGTTWSVVASPNVGSGNDLRGVTAITPTDAWAVGQSFEVNPSPLAEHWDGTAWTVVPTPAPLGGGTLTSVAAVSSNDVWAVGALGDGDNGTLAEHWDGTAWSIVATPAILGDALFSSATVVSASDVWAVGSRGSQTLTEHWKGSTWTIVASPNPLPGGKGNNFLTGVSALSSTDVWAVGSTLDFTLGELEQTVTLHWDGTAWTVVSSPDKGPGSNLLLGVDSPGSGVVFAAGTFRQGFAGTNRTLVIETTQG